MLFNFKGHSQTITVDSIFTQDGEFNPFLSINSITNLSLDAEVVLNNDTSLVRIVLETDDNIDYLIYEAYPLIVESNDFVINGACDETCFLDEIKPLACKVFLLDATIEINALHYSTTFTENLLSEQIKRKLEIDTLKSQTMNRKIVDFNMYWQSDVTSIVQLMYNAKKDMFGEKYNFRGWDYYRSGVFELLGHQNLTPETTSLTKSFDWRSRHGANCSDPGYYYDGDELGSGWLTDVRNQGDQKTCWAF